MAPSGERAETLVDSFYEIARAATAPTADDALCRFVAACDDALERLDPWERYTPQNGSLVQEADSWRLLRCLHAERARGDASRAQPPSDATPSPLRLVEEYFLEDREVRAMQAIVDWLEACARVHDASSSVPPSSRAVGALHWENTLHRLLNGSSLFDAGGDDATVTELDPDAPRRQRRALHALDERDDDNLCRRLFKELRCGRFEEAVSLCVDAGQMWRAMLLHGRRPLDFPDEPRRDARLPIVGNAARDLWTRSCARLFARPDENAHFRACLGVLCGDASAALPVCDEREDLLWAHLRAQIELRVDRRLRERDSLGPPSDAAADDDAVDGPPEMSIERVFGRVGALLKGEPETRHQEAQRRLVLDETDALLRSSAATIDDADFDSVRFLCHVVLATRLFGDDGERDVGDRIVRAYAERLIRTRSETNASPELVAFYLSRLPAGAQSEPLSELMWPIDDERERRRTVEAGVGAGLDARLAARRTVRRAIRALGERESDAESVSRAIGSLGWLAFREDQAADAVASSNAMIRALVFRGDVESASSVLAALNRFYPLSVIARSLSATSNALREHLCLKAYLEAIDGYASWYRQHVGGRPKSPEPPPPDCSFTDRVHREQLNATALQRRRQWAAAGVHQTNHVKQLLYNVLLFPEGWLVDDVAADRFDESREEFADRGKQLAALRRLCVPEAVLLLLKVLHFGEVDGHAEAIRLAELLASEKRKLYALFPKNKLKEVLHKIGESSLSLLENDRDPWGFDSCDS